MRLRLITGETNFQFIGHRRIFMAVSALMVAAAIAAFAGMGLNYGIDFRGGILIEVQTEGPADLGEIRSELGGLGLGEVSIQSFGAENEVLIRVQEQAGGETAQQDAIARIKGALGDAVEYRRTEFVGPKVGAELREAGTIAVLLAIGALLIYIWFRFEWQFGVGAVIALTHDMLLTVGLFALLQLEFNLSTLAAILTIAGYSINDTVVVFDRVRENLRKYKRRPLADVLNLSINNTLARTVMTSLTTLIALIALFVFGGAVIRDFSFAMIWGVLVGTYSSICLAVPLLLYMKLRPEAMSLGGDEGDEGTARIRQQQEQG